MQRNYLFSFILLLFYSGVLTAQATATAGPVGTNAYDVLEGRTGGAVFGVEGPSLSGSSSCTDSSRDGDHSDFGPHVTHVAETELPNNPTVFLFHSHIDEDSDRCRNLDRPIDRVRTEIKGGPEGRTHPELEHHYGDVSHYRWQFKLPAGFVGTSRFTHLFQLKPAGGDDIALPALTLTARADELEVIHVGDSNPPDFRDAPAIRLSEPSLAPFLDRWVEVYMMIEHTSSANLIVKINDVLTGASIVDYSTTGIDLWRGVDNSSSTHINRPKWGIYRGLLDGVGQRDETVRFANFCSSENGDICPSLLPTDVALTPPGCRYPVDEAENVPVSMQLVWDAVDGATLYEVFLGTDPTPPSVGTVSGTTYSPTLAYGQTYYYQIKAISGSESEMTPVKRFTTLPSPDPNGWDVVRGHAPPHLEDGGLYELDNTISGNENDNSTHIADEYGNIQHCYFSGPSGNYRWRYRFDSGNEEVTVVLRLAKLPSYNNMLWVEIKNMGFNQKISIKADNIKYDRSPTGSVEVDYPSPIFDDGEFHMVRFTFKTVNVGGTTMLETATYFDESATPFYVINSTTTSNSQYLDIGKSGGTNYGAKIDFAAINPEGAFPPATANRELPPDLLSFISLPLRWVRPLAAQNSGKARELTWSVADQVATDFFAIEGSQNGINFQTLGRLAAAGEQREEKSYQYLDNKAPLHERVYYRVKQTDSDGSFSYSNIAVAEPILPSGQQVQISPNPVFDLLRLSTLEPGTTAYRIIDLSGRKILQGKLTATNATINCEDLDKGIYFIQLFTPGGEPQVKRFIKN